MKEERQKRIRERQKEFFGEIENHKYVSFIDPILYIFVKFVCLGSSLSFTVASFILF